MNETTTFRRVAATLTIGSFSLAALMGIVALLGGGGDFGEGEGRVLGTTLIVGCASICVLCYLATAGTPWVAAGITGAVVVVLPTVNSLILVWADWDGDSEGLWKGFGVGVVLAVTCAQACLLLVLAGGPEGPRMVLWPTLGVAALAAALVSAMILGGAEATSLWRLLGVIAILDVLGTLVTIALSKFGGRRDLAEIAVRHEPDGGWWVTLSDDRAAAIQRLARDAGRPAAELVDEAVDRYLALEAHT